MVFAQWALRQPTFWTMSERPLAEVGNVKNADALKHATTDLER